MTYVLLLDDLRGRVDQQVTAASLARAMGSDVQVPDWDEVRGGFDRWLAAPPEQVADPDRWLLLQALGLRG